MGSQRKEIKRGLIKEVRLEGEGGERECKGKN